MKMPRLRLLPLLIVLFLFHSSVDAADTNISHKKTFIIHMDKSYMPESFDDHLQWYDASLKSVSHSADMLYSYNNVIHGYSVQLTVEEAKLLEEHPGIISVQEDVVYELHTTRSPEFLGLLNTGALLPQSSKSSDVIIGVLDTGVTPELSSFDDKELGPVPSIWKGTCEVGKSFSASSCNRKLIGARFFLKGYESAYGPIDETIESKSPRDDDGHGTHTATTAAGSTVVGASLFGFAAGTARGMAPHARVAAYKVCWIGGCVSSDILAAMDMAIADGVNILSLSLGGSVSEYFRDTVAIGAFAATSKGILVSTSAGNGGPSEGALSNVAPWMTTVGAGTMDRQFPSHVTLGNGRKLTGVSLYKGKPLARSVQLVYAGNASSMSTGNLCMKGSLIPERVRGKIVLCDRGLNPRTEKGLVVKDAGGIGMILSNTDTYGEELVADSHFIPTAAVGLIAGNEVRDYITSTHNPTATIVSGDTQLGIQPSPVVAAFSSRGPNPITPEILKPDLIAPGVNILAGWTGKVGPTGLREDTRRVDFNIVSGTSMACPHVSGLAALIKGAHPEWSPAAIRSALMTTAYSKYKNGERIQDVATGTASSPFDYGSGHVNPVSALDPGLVYDAAEEDYINFLCAIKYSSAMIKLITKRDYTCRTDKEYSIGDLNYPSFSVSLQTASGPNGGSSTTSVVKYTRTLTNMGQPASYKVSISQETKEVKIVVIPEVLKFSKPNEKKTYTVTFTADSMPSGTTSFAHLEWSDGKHIVSSPIAFSWT
ncbi:subtilisin-like protease SBT1.7 [Andrographis paniculata]|uniref:subtilisin-like protease SBT1.7 n=1 Tax=Andrographis paniculata TaxID=175694 RepID=UPI0021E7E685|nr:subtilisin-like protease SBT1.7 [Andrographis paniculata]